MFNSIHILHSDSLDYGMSLVTPRQWSFRKPGTMGNAGEPSGNWCLGPSTGDASEGPGVLLPDKRLRLYMQNPVM